MTSIPFVGLALHEVGFTLSQCIVGLCSEDGDDPTAYLPLTPNARVYSFDGHSFPMTNRLGLSSSCVLLKTLDGGMVSLNLPLMDLTTKSFECKRLTFTR